MAVPRPGPVLISQLELKEGPHCVSTSTAASPPAKVIAKEAPREPKLPVLESVAS